MIRTSTGLGITGLPWQALQKELAEGFGVEAPVVKWRARAHARVAPQGNAGEGSQDGCEKAAAPRQAGSRPAGADASADPPLSTR